MCAHLSSGAWSVTGLHGLQNALMSEDHLHAVAAAQLAAFHGEAERVSERGGHRLEEIGEHAIPATQGQSFVKPDVGVAKLALGLAAIALGLVSLSGGP